MSDAAEKQAQNLIFTLEALIEELETIANGKNYSPEDAQKKLRGIRLALEAEAP